jgi:hypothetical protein
MLRMMNYRRALERASKRNLVKGERKNSTRYLSR